MENFAQVLYFIFWFLFTGVVETGEKSFAGISDTLGTSTCCHRGKFVEVRVPKMYLTVIPEPEFVNV
jgi:hypothetical protein